MKLPSPKARKPLAVVVLDDDHLWRHFVKFILEMEMGITPFLASHGREALDILETRPIDVVISDLRMPGMSGLRFLGLARLLSPDTKVIIISMDFEALSTTPEELVARGATAAIPKTEIMSKLVNVLRNL